MDSFESASRAVDQALREGRIGHPVALRIVAHPAADHGLIASTLARTVEAACSWLGGRPERVDARGGVDVGQITTLIRFTAGQTALIGVGSRGLTPPLLEVVVVGDRGLLHWEPAVVPGDADTPAEAAPPSERARALVQAIGASLKTGRTVDAGGVPAADPGEAGLAPRRRQPDRSPSLPPSRQAEPTRPRLAPPYGVLLIAGAGTHQEDYARALAADPRCRLVGLTDEADVPPRRRGLNERLAHELDIPVLPDLDAALARADVQVVSVCAEPERRCRIIVRCAAAGKHLYLDKPLAASVAEARQAVAAVRRAGVLGQMFSQVHTAAAARARQLVDSGQLGELIAVHCDLFFAKGPAGTARLDTPRAEDPRPTRFERPDAKRELYNVGVYPLVLVRWLLGRDVRRVSAATANSFFAEHQRHDLEDFGVVLLELDGGATASLAVGRTGWRSHPMGGLNKVSLVGTRGVACVDAYRPRLEVWADDVPWTAPAPEPEDPMGFWRSTPQRIGLAPKRAWITPENDPLADARHFLDCLELGRDSDVPVEVGSAAVATLMAAYESAATGRVVTLPPQRP